MKILISADLEGISGVVHQTETNPGSYDYERGRALMTAEVNAAVAGVLTVEPGAEVLVADAHGPYRNLLPEDLDPRVRLVRGKPRPLGMLAGLDTDTDAVLLIGYHARSGTGPAVLAHTISDAVLDVRLDGRSVGEIGINTALAGFHGAPVVLLSGDDVACAELLDLVPGAATVAVKQALGQSAAIALHPQKAREQLRQVAAEAIGRHDQVPPLTLPSPLTVEIDLRGPHTIDLATLIPGVSRAPGARTVTFTAADMLQAHRLIVLITQLAQITPG